MRNTAIPLDFPDSDTIIYSSDNLVAIHCPASSVRSKQLVVTFHPLQLTHTLHVPRKGQSRETLRAAGLDSVQIIPRGNHWYQYDDIGEMITEVRRIADLYSEIVAYGQSMGAYGAIHTSALLRPSKVLAICPQFSIDPARISFDSGFQVLAKDISFIRDEITHNVSQDAEFVIAYDPLFPIDGHHYRYYEKHVKNLYRLRMPFCGHGVSEALKEANMIPSYLLRLITNGKNEILATRQEFRRHRTTIKTYQDAMKLALVKWHIKNKNIESASINAFKLYESTKRFSSIQLFCEVAEKLGTPQRAASRWFFALANFGKEIPPLAYVRAVMYSRMSGHHAIAHETCLAALSKHPNDFGLMREYIDILIHESKFEEAKAIAGAMKKVHGAKADGVIRNRQSVFRLDV
ncbi:hypothetical protein PS3A_13600 [Pseudomonas sp. 3A(2025)]